MRLVFGSFCVAAAMMLLAPVSASADPEPSCPAISSLLKSPPASARGLRTRVITLGTGGGPRIRVQRSQPSNLLVVDDRAYFVDFGHGALRQAAEAGFQPKDIGTAFITHLHVDHMSDLSAYLAYSWSNARAETVNIYGPPGTKKTVDASVTALAIPELLYAKQVPVAKPMAQLFEGHDIDVSCPAVVYQDDKVRVVAVENTHFQEMKLPTEDYGRTKAYSYRFETPDRVVVFSGDTGPSKNLTMLAKGADVLVTEAIDIDAVRVSIERAYKGSAEQIKKLMDHQELEHIRPADIGKMATQAGVKLVVLSHLAGAPDQTFDPAAFTTGVRKQYSGPVVLAQDLDQF